LTSDINFASALEDFRLARRKAALQTIIGRMRGKGEDLLSYNDVRKQLQAIESADRVLDDIPINSIVGSVNRYTDFTRNFLPKQSVSGERWARVKAASQGMVGLAPIEVYQIGEVYFVQDGNHRVSIARQSGANSIQAYVRKVHSRITITPEIQPDDLIIKAEYLDFLETTYFDRLLPQTDLNATSPGGYPFILQQIEAVKFEVERKSGKEIPLETAVLYWNEKIYLPIIYIIREKELLKDFHQRTETDLFIFLIRYQRQLVQELGWDITFETAAARLRSKLSPKIIRAFRKVLEAIFPDILKPGPTVGEWRQQQLSAYQGRLFADILVVITGKEEGWNTLEFALNIAKEEGSQVYGLHVSCPQYSLHEDEIQVIKLTFDQYCENFEVPGKLVLVNTNKPERLILERARWADLLLLPSHYTPKETGGFHLESLIRRCPTPILAIHEKATYPIKKGILAFDGSPKADEALFLATYLAKFWEMRLVVLSVFGSKKVPIQTLSNASEFLDRYKVDAEYVKAFGPPGTATIIFAIESQCDLIISGGYGSNLLKKLFAGSVIDEISQKAQQSLLICK